MAWLHQRGIVSCYDDFVGLPIVVLEDAWLLMDHEATLEKMRAKHGE